MANPRDADNHPATATRGWLLTSTHGTLSTISAGKVGLEGYPYGSVVPFVLTARGEPVILIARIAEHTANLAADPRGALLVSDPEAAEPQESWRVSLLGDWSRLVAEAAEGPHDVVVGASELEELDARYLERVPGAAPYRAELGFDFWRLTVRRARAIAGFGTMGWLQPGALLRDPGGGGVSDAAPGAIAHMNEDHAHNMVEMCTGLHGFTPEAAQMVSLDRTGFLVRTTGPERLVWFPFGREITAADIRVAVIGVLTRARQA